MSNTSAGDVTTPAEAGLTTAPAMKAGWRTTEFYVTILTASTPLLTLIFNQQFSSDQIQTWATVAAAIASCVYAMARSQSKRETMRAWASVETAAQAAKSAPQPTTPTAAPPAHDALAPVPVDTLALILARLEQLTLERRVSVQ